MNSDIFAGIRNAVIRGDSIEKAARSGNLKAFKFPRPLIDSNDFDFSFSGLKTAVFREVQTMKQMNNEIISDISASVQQTIVDVLIYKTLKAAQKYKVKSILLGGGVAANQKLRDQLKLYAIRYKLNAEIFVPSKNLCTDNAAMIAAAGYFMIQEMGQGAYRPFETEASLPLTRELSIAKSLQ